MKPEILRSETTHSGHLAVARLHIRIASGETVQREVESHGDSVAVLPFDSARRCALIVRQFRAPVFVASGEESLVEACAGMVETENTEATARREALEELGVRLTQLQFIARVWPSPGISTERASLYLAPYAIEDRMESGGGLAAEHENITVVELPLDELAAAADAGDIVDAKLFSLILALRARHPRLFDLRA